MIITNSAVLSIELPMVDQRHCLAEEEFQESFSNHSLLPLAVALESCLVYAPPVWWIWLPRDTMYKDYVQLVRIVATPLLSDMTIIPASKLPNKIAGNATLNRKLSKAAIRLALQTPVPGRGGIATKNKRAKAPYFFYLGTIAFLWNEWRPYLQYPWTT